MKLKPRTEAWRAKDRPGSKWHLESGRPGHEGLTACKRLIWKDEDEKRKLSKLQIDEVCQRCLGPCEALP